jgi:hypothetical protein
MMLFPVKFKVALVGLVVAGGAAAAVALGPAGLAVGQSSAPTVGQSSQTVQVQVAVNSPATLVAKGAGVDVSTTVTCSGQLVISGSVGVTVTEKVGKDVASGFGGASFDCADTPETLEVLAVAEAGGKAFDKGSAIAQATISACAVNGPCASQEVQPTIKIKK